MDQVERHHVIGHQITKEDTIKEFIIIYHSLFSIKYACSYYW